MINKEKPKIIHVDNDPEFLDIFSATFSRWFDITSVRSSEAALEKLKRDCYQCIITDYDMPGMDGIELLWETKQFNTRLPVIFFTGQGNEQVAREAFVLGASDYFTKDFYGPAATEKLVNSINNLIEKNKVVDALEKSQEIYRTIFETACSAMFIIEEDSTISLVNKTFVRMCGYAREEVENRMKWQEFIHPQDLPLMKDYFHRRLSEPDKVPNNYECRVKSRDGRILHIYSTVSMVPGTRRRVVSWLDITPQKESEDARQESEIRFGTVFDTVTDSIFIKDLDGRYKQVNLAFSRLYGIPKKELINRTDDDIFNVNGGKEIKKTDQLVKEGKIVNEEHTISINNKLVTLHVVKVPVRDRDGNINGICGIARDITHRKQAEEELRRQKDILTNIISNIPHFVFWKDRHSVFMGCNENLARVAGLDSADDIIGLTDFDLPLTREESEHYVKCDKEVMESGKPMLNIEETQLQADGRKAVLMTSKVPMRDSQGNIIGIMGIYSDITSIKKMEVQLQKSKDRYRNMLDSLADFVHVVDRNLRLVNCNRAVTDYLSKNGFSPESINGEDIFKLFPFLTPQVKDEYLEVLNTGKPLVTEEKSLIDDREIWTETRKVPIRDSGDQISNVVTIIHDVTRRKNTEQSLRCQLDKLMSQQEYDNSRILVSEAPHKSMIKSDI